MPLYIVALRWSLLAMELAHFAIEQEVTTR